MILYYLLYSKMSLSTTEEKILSTHKYFRGFMSLKAESLSKMESNHIMAMYFIV